MKRFDLKQDFHDYYFALSAAKRELLVAQAGTTIGYVERIAGGFTMPSLTLAVKLSRAAGIGLDAMVRPFERRHGRLA